MSKMPCACYKSKLLTELNTISRKDVLAAIYEVIQNNRNYTLEEAKNVKVLFKNEVKEVMINFGELED